LTEYHNPQQDPGAQKRLLITFFLVFVMIAALQYLMPKPQPPQQQKQATPQEKAATTPAAPLPVATPTPKPTPPATRKVAPKQATTETEATLENDQYRIIFTNRGAVVKSWVLKNFKDEKGSPLDLVNSVAAPTLGYPLSLFAYDKDLEKKLNEAMYVSSGVREQNGPATLTFEYSDGEITARKTISAGKDYVITVETEVTRNGQRVTAYPQWPGGLGDQASLSSYSASRIDWYQNGHVERRTATSGFFLTGKKWVSGGQTLNGPYQWVGTGDRYFFAAFMPESPDDTALVTLNNLIEVPRDPAKPNEKEKISVLGVAFGNTSGLTRLRVFAGPKAVNVLDNTHAQPGGPDLRATLDFGMFGFIARPLFLWLKWTYEHWIHNWGWAIAFLTLVITMALLPLRITSMKSSLKMQKIQPQVKAITEKYKRYAITDPRRQEMQKEMSALYKREGVNPVGGCFPMLLQMPFLFAFYSMLGNAIELRLAPWLWIKDLSAPDPLHLLPIAIVVTMFIMQKSTPQMAMDPTQQKMLNLMSPLMIGYISWFVASGLCIYWAISNLLGYFQQVVINRSELGQQVRKAQERRATRKK
jgi:YidC/Oxa1 family membrane protein insertase